MKSIHHWYVSNKASGEIHEDNIASLDEAESICRQINAKDKHEWGLADDWQVHSVCLTDSDDCVFAESVDLQIYHQ